MTQRLAVMSERAIAAAFLTSVLDDFAGPGLPLSVDYSTGRHLMPKVCAFMDHLAGAVGPYVLWSAVQAATTEVVQDAAT